MLYSVGYADGDKIERLMSNRFGTAIFFDRANI